jgi:hypothetical protein
MVGSEKGALVGVFAKMEKKHHQKSRPYPTVRITLARPSEALATKDVMMMLVVVRAQNRCCAKRRRPKKAPPHARGRSSLSLGFICCGERDLPRTFGFVKTGSGFPVAQAQFLHKIK